ncbi:hypothetical protein ABIE49_006118 [Bradyrhizobium sp. OAE829]
MLGAIGSGRLRGRRSFSSTSGDPDSQVRQPTFVQSARLPNHSNLGLAQYGHVKAARASPRRRSSHAAEVAPNSPHLVHLPSAVGVTVQDPRCSCHFAHRLGANLPPFSDGTACGLIRGPHCRILSKVKARSRARSAGKEFWKVKSCYARIRRYRPFWRHAFPSVCLSRSWCRERSDAPSRHRVRRPAE